MTKNTIAFIESLFEFYQDSSSGREPENAEALREAWDEIEGMKGFYPVVRLHRDDIRGQGKDPSSLSDAEMARMADRIGDAMMESGAFWDSLDALTDELPTLIDSDSAEVST